MEYANPDRQDIALYPNLRDYILYYPRDYRFPYRHNASLSLWPDVMTFGNVNYVCWIYEWMNEWI